MPAAPAIGRPLPPLDERRTRACRQKGGHAVEEDEIGTARALSHGDYVACVRCGRVTPRQEVALVQGDALEDTSEYEYLCAACQQALADGEVDLPAPPA